MAAEKSLWNSKRALVLASKSLTRKNLLESCGIPFTVAEPKIDERKIEAEYTRENVSKLNIAFVLAEAKARSISATRPDSFCLGADQILLMDDQIFHKPGNRPEAEATLDRLLGRTHQLISAFAIALNGQIIEQGQDSAELTMRNLDREQICRYLDFVGTEAFMSVGGYQVEAAGIHLFKEIRGAHSTILGLPLLPLLAAFRTLGVLEV